MEVNRQRDPRVDPKPGDVLVENGACKYVITGIRITVYFSTETPDGALQTLSKYHSLEEFRESWKDAEVFHVAE